MPIQLLTYLIKNPFTSTTGTGLILVNIGAVLTMIGNGTPFSVIIADPHFSGLMAGFAAFAAKDMNTTGGTRAQ